MLTTKKNPITLFIILTLLIVFNILTKSSVNDVHIENIIEKISNDLLLKQIEKTEVGLLTVSRVVDGDTIELNTGEKVRYIGINTPETKHPTRGVECFGQEAYEKNKQLVEGKEVILEKDISETDRYGRLLRYVYVDGIMINELLIKEGYAQASSFPPDVKYQDQFVALQTEASNASKGIWGSVCNSL